MSPSSAVRAVAGSSSDPPIIRATSKRPSELRFMAFTGRPLKRAATRSVPPVVSTGSSSWATRAARSATGRGT